MKIVRHSCKIAMSTLTLAALISSASMAQAATCEQYMHTRKT